MTHQPLVGAGNDAPCLLEAASLLHGSVTAGTGGGGDGGGDSSSSCGRCGGGFSLFFNKRVACGGGCGLAVCRRCAPWSPTAKAYVCCVCSSAVTPATLATPTPSAASVSAGAGVTSSHTSLQPPGSCSEEQQKVEAGVRSHIEALVEGQVGGPLDPVSATPNTTHPLHRPLPPEDLPTTCHTHLTDHVTQVLRDAMILPRQMEGYDPAVSPETPVEDFNSHTYEDILATAILNKVLESCDGKRPSEVTIEVSHDVASTDTDSGMSGGAKESHRRRHKSEAGSEGSEERSLTPPARQTLTHRPPTASPDQGVVTDDCWGPAHAALDAPLQFKIEEHVEEVTTHHVTDDDDDDEAEGDVSDSGGSWRGSRGSLEERRRTRRHKKVTQHSVTQDPLVSCLPVALPDPAQVTSRRVSFPELGRDIIQDSCSDSECCAVSPGDMVVDADSWEENWLFRRHRLAGSHTSDPVTMLIPNPEAHVTPTVGNRDVDELSELSEQQSVGSSEPWSDSDGEGEGLYPSPHAVASRELSMLAGEIVAEFGQQDREYTVDYSSASRMSARRTPPPHSPSLGTPSRLHTLPQHTAHPSEHYNGKPARGSSRDSESVSDSDRPIPKPRKLSLATTPSSRASDKSPPKTLTSPVEDLTILSPPLEVPLPSEAKSSSETVWFVETPQDCIVPQGRTLRLSCALNTKRPMGITWYHNGSLVRAGRQEVWVWRRGPTHHLYLYNMTPDAAGVYAAAAYTASHCVWAFCRVHYKASARPGKRPIFTKGLTDATVEEGGELSLQCQVQGHPEPRVTFSHGTRQLEPSSRLAIESDQYGTWTLRLTECVLTDAGEVTATASNTLAATTCRCQVKVLPEGTPLPRQDATRLSRPQSNQQLKGKPDSKPTHRTPPTGSHPPDNSSCTLSTNALTTSARLTHEEPLTKSSGVHSGDGEQEDIQQVPTKPGTIAEREHRKWEAAVPLPNNPYSPERLAHRLSHTRPPDHPLQTRHAPPVEFPRGDEVDLDPSLQDGMSSREDLRRYSRDYYVGSSTSKTAPRGRNSNLNYPKHPQNQSPGSNQHQLTNGHHSLRSTSQQVIRNGQEIRIAVGSHSTTSHRGENLKDSRGKPETGTESPEVIESCRAGDWKDELKDIQAARVEQEVARLQRTIEETQRRWETYARHAPGRGTSVLSDGSIEHLHHPRPEAYLVPPRHDLWRTVSEDTISVPLKEAPSKQPLLRHISMDNLRPATKVSNIHPLAHHPHQSTTSINSVGSSLDGPGHPSSYSPAAHLGRSVESVGEYSDRDALDSDGSLHTPEESLALPSVRKLASRFDSGPQKVNNLDKHGTSNSLTYSGKNIQSGGRNTQGDRAAFTNNLNKSTEKPYIMKEVRSLAEVQAPTDPDSHSSDDDHSVFDDAATVTSMSLPPTPVSLSNQHSYSASSLIDTDSSSHFDSRDPDTSGSRTFFGVTLRRANRSSPVHVYSKKRDSVSDEASQADPRDLAARRLSSRSTVSLGHAPTPSSSEEDTPATLRQSTIIKVDAKPQSSFSNTWNLAPLKSSARSQSLANLHTNEDQSSGNFPTMKQQNMGSAVGYAFAPKGKRSMSSFLKAYSRQKSLHDIHQIDEKAEENFSNQKAVDNQYQQRLQNQWTQPASLPSTLRKAKSEKYLRNIDYESEITVNTNSFINKKTQPSVHQSTTVNGHTFEGELLKNTSKTSAPKGFVEPSVAGMTIPSQGSFSDDKETPAMKKSVPKEANDSSDEDENSSHSSQDDVAPVAATMVYCTGDDPSEIVLNMAHVSAFQEHLKREAPSSPSDGTQVSEVTGGGTMRRHKSVGDLLKEYSNIKSLDRKKDVVSSVSPQKVATTENIEPYKTVIEVQHSSTQGSSTAPYSSHTKTQSLKKTKPKTTPAPMKKSLSHSYFKHVDQKAENTHTVNSGLERKSPDDHDGRVFHASTIYVGDDGSDSHPDYSARITVNGQTSPPVKREVTVNQCYVNIPTDPQNALPGGSLDAMTTEKRKKEERDKHDPINTTVEVNHTFVTVKDKEISSSSHVSVVSVIEKDDVNNSSEEEEETEKINPKAIKEMIMRESRTGKSGGISAKALARNQKIMDASVPLNSPFSPLRSQPRKKSSSSLSPSEEAPPKLCSQDSQDEGVGFPSDTPPSANSQDPAEHEGGQPRV